MHHPERDVIEALHRIAPNPAVPPGLVAGARLKRARRRAALGATGAVGLLAVAVGLGAPALLQQAGGGAMMSQDGPAAQSQLGPMDEAPVGIQADAPTADQATAALASQRLAWDAILGAGPGNQVVSPSSLSLSLAMAAEGAEGDSLISVAEALGLSGEDRSAAYSSLRWALADYETPPDRIDLEEPPSIPQLHLANRLVTLGIEAEAPFVERLERWFDVPVVATTHEEAKAVLDAWAREHTAGLIKESAIEVDPRLRLVTQDALVFSATWATPFPVDDLPLEFDGAGTVDAMQGVVPARYAEGERWTAVRLSYDNRLSADVILPREGLAPSELTAADLEQAAEALAAAPEQQVDVTMPQLDLRSKMDLLKALPSVDLSDLGGMFDGAFAGQWWQQSVLQVSAKGTVGAALTEMGVYEAKPLSDFTFVADRPYVLRVVDTQTDWPLFLASITDPGA